jgi:hypothetical protein
MRMEKIIGLVESAHYTSAEVRHANWIYETYFNPLHAHGVSLETFLFEWENYWQKIFPPFSLSQQNAVQKFLPTSIAAAKDFKAKGEAASVECCGWNRDSRRTGCSRYDVRETTHCKRPRPWARRASHWKSTTAGACLVNLQMQGAIR